MYVGDLEPSSGDITTDRLESFFDAKIEFVIARFAQAPKGCMAVIFLLLTSELARFMPTMLAPFLDLVFLPASPAPDGTFAWLIGVFLLISQEPKSIISTC